MTMLRVEWLRLVRTRRWIALLAPFLLFGLASPLLVRYQQQLVERFATGVQITFPKPTVLAALQQHEANAAQLGALAVIIVAAMALAIDADPQRSIFVRTRARSLASVVAVRAGVVAAAAVAAWLLGSLGAWYETVVLIGAPDVPGALAGIGFGALAQLVSVALVVAA
ncbi:MAG: ABC transporter, partial [Thermoleophilia bacterium]|nr:ABC transporter [Thermoleophilia bacterium]